MPPATNRLPVVVKFMSVMVCGKNSLDRKLHRKIPAHAPKNYTGLFTSICRGTVSHNVYLTEKL